MTEQAERRALAGPEPQLTSLEAAQRRAAATLAARREERGEEPRALTPPPPRQGIYYTPEQGYYVPQAPADWRAEIDAYNDSLLGKLASPFVWFAEQAERALSILPQLTAPPEAGAPEPADDFLAAWRAGSLFYESFDLGGPAMLARARTMLAAGTPLDDVRAQLYGTYALEQVREAEARNNWNQMILDPLWILQGVVKPVQWIQRYAAGARWLPRAGEAARELAVGARAASEAAETLGRAGRAVEASAEALRSVALAQEAAETAARGMSWFERAAITLTGGLPRTAEEAIQWGARGKVGLVQAARALVRGDFGTALRWGALPHMWFRLTPESAAIEVINNLDRFVQTIASGARRPEEIVAVLNRARSAIAAGDVGHMAATSPGGRAMISWLDRIMPNVENLLAFWADPSVQMQLGDLGRLSRLAGMSVDDFMAKIWDGEIDDLMETLARGIGNPADEMADIARIYAQRIAEGGLDRTTLEAFGKVFEGLPYTEDLWRVHMRTAIREQTARLARDLLGVQAAGFWLRQTNALKSVETLLYLRLNPGYFVRNLWNNEGTMLAHGVWNLMTGETIARVWDRAGITDPRLWSGMGPAEVRGATRAAAGTAAARIREAFNAADDIIGDTVRGDPTWLQKLVTRVQTMLPTDAGRWAQTAESWASARAMTSALLDVYPQLARVGVGYSAMTPALRSVVGDEAARAIEAALPHAMSPVEREAIFFADNLNITAGAVFDDLARRTGIDPETVRGVMGSELMGSFEDDLVGAMRSGEVQQIDDVLFRYGEAAERRIDDTLRGASFREYAATTIQADGPNGVLRVSGEWQSYGNAAIEADLRNLDDSVARLRLLPTREQRQSAWRAIDIRRQRWWTRINGVYEDQARGIVAGARAAGLEMDDTLVRLTQERVGAYREFYAARRRLTDAFYNGEWADTAARETAWVKLNDELDTAYALVTDQQNRIAGELDSAVGALIADPQARGVYDVGRAEVRRIQNEYMVNMRAAYRRAMYMDEPTRAAFFRQEVTPMRVQFNMDRVQAEKNLLRSMRQPAAAAPAPQIINAIDEAARAGVQVHNPVGKAALLDAVSTGGTMEVRVVGQLTGQPRAIFTEAGEVLEGATMQLTSDPQTGQLVLEVGHDALRLADGDFQRRVVHEYSHYFINAPEAGRAGLDYGERLAPILEATGVSPAGGIWGAEEIAHNPRFQAAWEMYWANPEGARVADLEMFQLIDDAVARETTLGQVRRAATYDMTAVTLPQTGRQAAFVPDLRELVPTPRPDGMILAEAWQTEGGHVMDEIGNSARDLMGRGPLRIGGLSEDAQQALRTYATQIEDEASGVMMASLNYANTRRDMALLNYSRRTDFDTYAGMVFPFSFWATHSALNWMLWSVDHPAMMSTFLRLRKMSDAASTGPGMPRRMRGFSVPIPLPFAPAWMGPGFVNPLGIALPLDQWIRGGENIQYELDSDEGRVLRYLENMRDNGQISPEQYQEAANSQSGPHWDFATSAVENGEDNWLDAFSILVSPHAPIVWAYNASRGRNFQPGPFLPITRTIRGLAGAFGADVNIEAPLRRALGLPSFDRYDEYRIQRQLADMAMEGYPLDQLNRAGVEQAGPMWEMAEQRALQQYSVGANLGLLGIPTQAYPPGEAESRELARRFGEAVEAEDRGQDGAINAFLNQHPEVGLRLGLNDTPQERTQRFLVDLVWDGYNNLPSFNRQEVVEQFGPLFEQAFLSRATRSYDSVPPEVLAMWARALGQDPPRFLVPGPGTAMALQLTPPEIANRIQVFYDSRRQFFDWETVRGVQEDYFRIDEGGARGVFLATHPELRTYWDWRRDFLYRNPDLIPYMVEDPESYTYPSGAALAAAEAGQPNFRWEEWQQHLGPHLSALMADYAAGETLPAAANDRLGLLAEQMGVSREVLLERITSSTGLAQ